MSTQKSSCYIILKGLDDVLAREYGDMNTRIMAGYRIAFEESRGIQLSKDIDDSTKEALFKFIEHATKVEKKRASENARKIRAVSDAQIFRDLNKKFGASFNDRISMIARLISSRITDYAKANPTLTRKEIMEQVGLLNLVKDARDLVVGMANSAKNNNDTAKRLELIKVLNNWSALVYMSQPILKQFEDVDVNITTDFVLDATDENYNENDTKFNFEESVREQWQTDRDKESSFGTIGKNVRRALSRIPSYDTNGRLERDDLGVVKTMMPIKVHQMLLDILRNVSSSTQMEQVLREYAKDNAWVSGIVQEIANDPLLKTRMFVDLCKNFQIYSDQKTKDGKVKTRLLNLEDSRRQYQKYSAGILLGNFGGNSIFRRDPDGNIVLNEASIGTVIDTIRRNFTVDKTEQEKFDKDVIEWNKGNHSVWEQGPIRPRSEFEKKKRVDQIILLNNILSEYLGLPVDADMLNVLLNNRKDTRELVGSINELFKYSLVKIADYNINASSFLNNADFKEKINKILRVVSKYNNGLALDSRIRYRGNTYYSNVVPSYLGDFIGYIQNCSKNNDKNALLKFLENKFFSCPTFRHPYDGSILNIWARDLYNSNLDDDTSFANNIAWKKGLGIDDVDFEDFGENQHIKYLMSEFHSERDIKESGKKVEYISREAFNNPNFRRSSDTVYYIEGTNKAFRFNKRVRENNGWEEIDRNDYAWYPCFIMGDANVAKFIKARRYSKNEIIDGFYNIYLAELERQSESRKLKDYWEQNGISPNQSMIEHMDKFCMLPFLNETYKGSHSKYYDIASRNRWHPYAVRQAIEEYLKDTSKEFTDKMIAKKNIKEDEVDRATDFFYNTSLATLSQLQLMTVDVAFYKDMKDLQKRYKEIHAPGSKLDIHAVDPWNNNNPILSQEDPTEKVVYFKEVKTDSRTTDPEFYKALVEAFGENDWRTKQYTRNKSTDGQGYRSFSSYRKVMIMAGQWDKDCQRAYETIMSIRENMRNGGRKTPTIDELRELDNCQVVFQPIKPYLYGLETIQGSNMLISVQHKYAEVPLIPELLPEGSKIRELAEFLEDEANGVDLACSTEVVKVGEYGSVDITSDINNLKNAVIHKLNYSDFRIQTNVPNHIYHSRLFGTQFRKLIMSNLRREDYYDYIDDTGVVITKGEGKIPLTKTNLIKFYNALIVGNILDSFKEFQKIAGDKYKLSQTAIQQVLNNDRQLNDNILALSINEFNDFVVPLFEGGLEHDAASLLFSIYKKIVNKQSILGGSAVQVSDFGITGSSEGDHLRYVTEEVNGKTNIKYAECEIPFNFSYINSKGEEVKLNFTDYCNPDGTFIMVGNQTKIEKEFPGILDIIAYRIPTERAYSMMNLKVVRCSHPMAGGTIKVPSQGPTIAGFDFDVDKLYFMRKEFKQKGRYNQVEKKIPSKVLGDIWRKVYDNNPQLEALLLEAKTKAGTNKPLNQYWDEAISGTTLEDTYSKEELFEEAAEDLGIDLNQYTQERKFVEYDFNKSPFEQSTTARNNMILELSRKRLEDYETFEERLTPGGFRNPSKAARVMRELLYRDNSSSIKGNELNLSEVRRRAETEKDPEPEYDPSNPMTIITYNKQNQIASKLIGIFANHNTHHAFISSLAECKFDPRTGSIAFGSHPEGLYDLLHAPNGADTFLSMAEYLASSVDAVKDPVLNFLNLNTLTADSGALLSRLGYSFEEIGLLFNQPIIRELCEYCVDNNITDITNGISEIVNRHKISGFEKLGVNPHTLSTERLAYNVTIEADKVEREVQIQALKLFSQISNQAKDLSQFILNSKFTAANSVSSTFGDAYEKMDRLDNYLRGTEQSSLIVRVNDNNDPGLTNILAKELGLGSNEYIIRLMRNPMAFEQVMSDCNLEALDFFNRLVPYGNHTYTETRRVLSNFTRGKYLQGEVIDNIFRDIPVYMLQREGRSRLNPLNPYKDREGNATTMTNREYYLNVFPKELYSFLSKHKELQNYNLFKYLSPNFETDKEGNQKFFISPQDTGGIGMTTVDLIRQEWMNLYNNKDTKWIVEGIFNYSFYTVGFNFNHNSFINLVPTEFKLDYVVAEDYDGNPITYIDYLREIMDNKHNVDAMTFADLFVRNHPNESSLVYSPKGKAVEIIEGLLKTDSGVPATSFTISKNNMGTRLNSFIIDANKDEGVTYFRPYVKIGDTLYRAVGNAVNRSFYASNTNMITYQRVSILGDTINSIDYADSDTPTGRAPEVRTSEESKDTTSDSNTVLTDEKLKELYASMYQNVKDMISTQILNNPESGVTTKSEAERLALAWIQAQLEETGSLSRNEKIQNIKDSAPELLQGFTDAEGNPIC